MRIQSMSINILLQIRSKKLMYITYNPGVFDTHPYFEKMSDPVCILKNVGSCPYFD